jgi:N-acetylglucosaminyl-diphospho-decaprenol L-rhamnosyltransferase
MLEKGVLLSIVIVNWNTSAFLEECLHSISLELPVLPPGRVETFVVDNGSTDGSDHMVRQAFPWVHLLQNQDNVGFARANNQAIREAAGRYILLLNSDAKVLGGALGQLVAFLEERPQVGAVGPRLLNADGSLQPSCQPMLSPMREFWRLSFLDRLVRRATYDVHSWQTSKPRQVEVLKGACLLLRQDALKQVGLLDESYFMYTEEVDLCYRLAQHGWELWWEPRATVVHYGEASSRQMAEEMYLQLYRSKVQFYRKYGGEKRASCFKRLVKFAYWSRVSIIALLRPFFPSISQKLQLYRQLLDELSGM